MTVNIVMLLEMGFQVVGGQLDYKNVNYGQMTVDGPLLTPDGEALVQSLDAGVSPAAKRGRPRKVDVEAAPEAAEG